MFRINHAIITLNLSTILSIIIVFSQPRVMATEENIDENMFLHVSKSNQKFCSHFYTNVASKINHNVVSSPLSAHLILSLVASGAREQTADELKGGLCLPEDDSVAHDGIKSLINCLNNVTEVELNLANAIYVQENVTLVPEFLSTSSLIFNTDPTRVDFKNSTDSARQINSWVEKETKNKIKGVICADDIDEDTKTVLINAIYFKGSWAQQFDAQFTENRPFYITKDVKTHVPTMFKKFEYPHGYLEELNSEIIELPYSNKDFSMLILLPNDVDGLQFLESNFDQEIIENVKWKKNKVDLYLPKFKVEATIDLEKTLQEMGMKTMFSDLANFSGITDLPLKVDKIIQKAFVEVNEEGCEAAAATVLQIRTRRAAPMPDTFQVDRPFMFAVQHKPSKILLFVGSIRNLQTLHGRDEL